MFKFVFGAVLLLIVLFCLLSISIFARVFLDDFLEEKYNNYHTVINKKIEGKVINKNKNKFITGNGINTVITNINYFVQIQTKIGTYTLHAKRDYLDLIIGETYTFDRIIHKDNNTGKIVKDYLELT